MQNLGLHIEENAESIEFGFKTTDIPNFDNIKLFHQNMFLNEPIKKTKMKNDQLYTPIQVSEKWL